VCADGVLSHCSRFFHCVTLGNKTGKRRTRHNEAAFLRGFEQHGIAVLCHQVYPTLIIALSQHELNVEYSERMPKPQLDAPCLCRRRSWLACPLPELAAHADQVASDVAARIASVQHRERRAWAPRRRNRV